MEEAQGTRRSFEITCSHCGKADTVPFEPFPGSVVLCRDCMSDPTVERVGGRLLHAITCSSCGQQDHVPFKPDSGSRVLCRNCHATERDQRKAQREKRADPDAQVTKVRIEIRCDRCGAEDVLNHVPRTSGPILCRVCAGNTFSEDWQRRHRLAGTKKYPFTCARCHRLAFAETRPNPRDELVCKRCNEEQTALHNDRLEERELMDAFLFVRRPK
jgi:CxxC-x17-CxxC domain-containing protein